MFFRLLVKVSKRSRSLILTTTALLYSIDVYTYYEKLDITKKISIIASFAKRHLYKVYYYLTYILKLLKDSITSYSGL